VATPTPGEPFSEAAGEAVQTAVMATRLVMAIADAVRRHQQKKNKGKEDDAPPAEQAVTEAAEGIKGLLPTDISAALTREADWPRMAQQLMALRNAGVDLEQFLPRLGEIAVTVQEQVTANAARVASEGTGEWERMLRETLPAGPVREAILSSPTWPDVAATMARLDERGVDVRQILASAHDEGLGVDQAVAKVLGADAAPAMSRDALLSYGPLTAGLDVPVNLRLADREQALKQLSIGEAENARFVRWVTEAMPGKEREASLMVTNPQWPLLALRMATMEKDGKPVQEHLKRLMADTSWEKGPTPMLGRRLVEATNEALRRPLGDASPGSRVKVNTTAARATSTSLDPTKVQAKAAAPAEAGVAPHRQTGPAPSKGKAK
jgi:hypothetical protein